VGLRLELGTFAGEDCAPDQRPRTVIVTTAAVTVTVSTVVTTFVSVCVTLRATFCVGP